jgi:hypothetical protein
MAAERHNLEEIGEECLVFDSTLLEIVDQVSPGLVA